MMLMRILVEAIRSCAASYVPSVSLLLIVAGMCSTTMLTVGRSAAAERSVLERIEAAGAREITITDTVGGLIDDRGIRLIASLSPVERVVGLSVPFDSYLQGLGPGGQSIPSWSLSGNIRAVAILSSGRWPDGGEAIISDQAAAYQRMDGPAGALSDATGASIPIVGTYRTRPPFDDLDSGALIVASAGATLNSLRMVASDSSSVPVIQRLAISILAPSDLSAVTVRSPATLAELEEQIRGEIAGYGRGMLLLILVVGSCLIFGVVFADVIVRRRDLGRRRVLGATRSFVLGLVILRTALPAAIGAVIGSGLALIYQSIRWQNIPDESFVAGVILLTVLAAGVSASIPAFFASVQDPVKVMRAA